jgi:uncharacterized membrane protein YtjA (UPF0391 family)
MLKYAVFLTLAALLAGFMGYGAVLPQAAYIARIFFGLFLILAVIFMVLAALGVGAKRKVTK